MFVGNAFENLFSINKSIEAKFHPQNRPKISAVNALMQTFKNETQKASEEGK